MRSWCKQFYDVNTAGHNENITTKVCVCMYAQVRRGDLRTSLKGDITLKPTDIYTIGHLQEYKCIKMLDICGHSNIMHLEGNAVAADWQHEHVIVEGSVFGEHASQMDVRGTHCGIMTGGDKNVGTTALSIAHLRNCTSMYLAECVTRTSRHTKYYISKYCFFALAGLFKKMKT